MRSLAAVLAAAAMAALGAVILGEYPFVGFTPLFAGPVFGVVVAEVLLSVARAEDLYLRAASALLAEAGLVWALDISTGHRLDLAAGTGWVGVAAGTVAAPVWLRSWRRRGGRSAARA